MENGKECKWRWGGNVPSPKYIFLFPASAFIASRVCRSIFPCAAHTVFFSFSTSEPRCFVAALLAARFSSDPAVRAAQHSLGFQICCFLRFLARFPRLLRPFPCLVLRWCALFLSFSFSLSFCSAPVFASLLVFRFSCHCCLLRFLLETTWVCLAQQHNNTSALHSRYLPLLPIYGSPGSFNRAYVHVCLAVYVCMCVCVCALGRGYVWVSLPAMLTRSTPLPISCARFI